MVKRKKNCVAGLPLFMLIALAVNLVFAGSLYAQNLFWTDDANNPISSTEGLKLSVGEQKIIRLRADVPANQTLKAFTVNVNYDGASIRFVSSNDTGADLAYVLTNPETFPSDTGIIKLTGFDTAGVAGGAAGAVATLIEFVVEGKAAGTGNLAMTVDDFGESASNPIAVTPVDIPTDISGITVDSSEVYWTDTAGIRLTQVNLLIGEEKVIRLKAGVPDTKTLGAFKYTLTYDSTVIEVVNAVPSADTEIPNNPHDTTFPSVNINKSTAGQIITNGFTTQGIAGPAIVSFIDVTVKGLAAGSSDFKILVNSFGETHDSQFAPVPDVSNTNFKINTITSSETYWADTANQRLSSASLNCNGTQTIRLMATVPDSRTLNAYKFTLTYDSAKVNVAAVKTAGSAFPPANINSSTAGTIIINGFDTKGVKGPAVIGFADVTMTWKAAGTFTFGIKANSYGTDSANQFLPPDSSINITVAQCVTPPICTQPTAGFSANPDSGMVPLEVTFTDTSGNATSWQWDFGDGKTSTSQNPVHEYTSPGTYTVKQTVSNSCGSATATKTVTVEKCMAAFTVVGTGNALEVLFDGSSSSNAVSYMWDFGDGVTGEGATATHTYAQAGTYTVKLKVTGSDENCVGVSERTVTVSESCVASAFFAVTISEESIDLPPFFPSIVPTRTLVFDASGSTADTYSWDFGDENTGTGESVTHTYAADGTYTVTLTVTANGCSDTSVQTVTVGGTCMANAAFTAFTTENSLTVTFSADGSVGETYSWTFGDGTTGSGMTVSKTYDASGTYDVNLTVTADGGCTDTAAESVTVAQEDCDAVAAFTYDYGSGLTVIFNTEGTVGSPLFDYGDGKTGTETSHTYAAAGTYTVKLTATADNGCKAVFSDTVNLTACDASAVFTAAVNGLTATFNTENTSGALMFEYGDGSTGTESTYTYGASGTYEVVLTATGNNGCTRESSRMVTVCGAAAVMTAEPAAGMAPLTVAFDSAGSVGDSITWDFGDGNTDSGAQISYTYAVPGTYTVMLTVQDTDGGDNCSATDEAAITVSEACTVIAKFTAAPETGVVPLTVTFNAEGSSEGEYTWDFGDGQADSGITASHTYATAGTYTITLTVSNDCDSATSMKTVTAVLPSGDEPEAPVLAEPADGMPNIALKALLKTGAFKSPVGAAHGQTKWQIALDPAFTQMVYSLTSSDNLTSLTLPDFILTHPGTSYYWRAMFTDSSGRASGWSDVFTFVTVGANEEDLNGNGVPDDQEVVNPPKTINGLWARILSTDADSVGVETDDCGELGWVKWISAEEMAVTAALPAGYEFPYGFVTYKTAVNAGCDSVTVNLHLTKALPDDFIGFKYSQKDGWLDVTDLISVSDDRKVVTFVLIDGGAGDSDGVKNGWIVDPVTIGVVPEACCEGGGGSDTCFIESASGNALAVILLALTAALSMIFIRRNER